MAVEIYLIRHGETEWNRRGRIQGQSDSPLTARGRAQAEGVGRILAGRFAGGPPPAVHVSPLGRTRQTAALIGRHLDLAGMIIEPRIREVTMGRWDGLTHDEIERRFPDLELEWSAPDWCFLAPAGEGRAAALARVGCWLGALRQPVVAVSHGLIGRLIRGCYLGLPVDEAMRLPVPQDVVWHLAEGRIEALS